jgi:hypothetical protein
MVEGEAQIRLETSSFQHRHTKRKPPRSIVIAYQAAPPNHANR